MSLLGIINLVALLAVGVLVVGEILKNVWTAATGRVKRLKAKRGAGKRRLASDAPVGFAPRRAAK